jgi:hypothetical protein
MGDYPRNRILDQLQESEQLEVRVEYTSRSSSHRDSGQAATKRFALNFREQERYNVSMKISSVRKAWETARSAMQRAASSFIDFADYYLAEHFSSGRHRIPTVSVAQLEEWMDRGITRPQVLTVHVLVSRMLTDEGQRLLTRAA